MDYENERITTTRKIIHDCHIDELSSQIISEYYNDLDMVVEYKLKNEQEKIMFSVNGSDLEISVNDILLYSCVNEYIFNNSFSKGKYIIRIKGKLKKFGTMTKNIRKVLNWNYYLENLENSFLYCLNLKEVPNYIPKGVQNINSMFHGCSNFNSDISKWDVSNITTMYNLFKECYKFNSDLSKWNVSSVINTSGMFGECCKFSSDLSKWDVSNVIEMSEMFIGCQIFNSDLSNWNISKAQYISAMFCGCHKFNSDLSKWTVSNMRNLDSVFAGCYKFNSDLSNWNVYNVKCAKFTFANCKKFNSDISKWKFRNISYTEGMFEGCNIQEEYKPKCKN